MAGHLKNVSPTFTLILNQITNIEFILRGYSNIIEKLTELGADIQLIED